MSLQSKITALATAIGADIKTLIGQSAAGRSIVDFGANGSDTATIAVIGQTNITMTRVVRAGIEVKDSADHSADEHLVEEIEILAGNVVAGTGFTIYARTGNRKLYGKFNVAWNWR